MKDEKEKAEEKAEEKEKDSWSAEVRRTELIFAGGG